MGDQRRDPQGPWVLQEVEGTAVEAILRLVRERFALERVSLPTLLDRTGLTLPAYVTDGASGARHILGHWLDQRWQAHVTRLWEIFSNERDCHEGLRAAFTAHAVMLSGLYGGREHEVRDLLGRPRPRDQRYLFRTVRGMIRRAQQAEALRTDLPPGELANYALNALAAAEGLPVKEAVQRIVKLTLAAIERNAAD